nr:hypothetical protein [Chloroflexaceae bacterium]
AQTKADWRGALRHVAYAGGWKKFEPLWDAIIRLQRVAGMRPMLERVLTGVGHGNAARTLPTRDQHLVDRAPS